MICRCQEKNLRNFGTTLKLYRQDVVQGRFRYQFTVNILLKRLFFANFTSTDPTKNYDYPDDQLKHDVYGCDFNIFQPSPVMDIVMAFGVGASNSTAEVEQYIWFHRSHRHGQTSTCIGPATVIAWLSPGEMYMMYLSLSKTFIRGKKPKILLVYHHK